MKTSLRTIARTFRLGRKETIVGRKAALQGATENSFAELNSADKRWCASQSPTIETHFENTHYSSFTAKQAKEEECRQNEESHSSFSAVGFYSL